ncbi:hypothetical protein [Litoreibacter arenae]|uniref:Uncharacterized protein n=1 Tax=Litoreibacter arenae DSM 19593 TaxID=1123360 RepID=S9QHJ3_9RHOB|nr:hypothetical protein [Litoreibacter arenae]EPX80931.1 hypothetical protein thalar_01153 [Litoreibacter arenae DSM 19593]
MPKLIKLLLRHALGGAFAGVVFSGLLIWSNVVGLRHLVLETADGPLAAGIMTVFFVITFASVQMGRAIMAMAEPADDDTDYTPPSSGQLVPVRVENRG